MQKLNTQVQEARALYKTARKYEGAGVAGAIPPQLVSTLAEAIEGASAADAAQQAAMRESGRRTDAQDKAMTRAFGLVRKLRAAAKACFGDRDKQAMSDFHVGKIIQSVKAMCSELVYLNGVIVKYSDALTGFGVRDVEILKATSAELSGADVDQENARKAQKAATAARDKALDNLEVAVRKVRNAAISIFGDDKAIMIEFESITPARKARAKVTTPVAVS